MATEPSALALFWAGVIAAAILVYVVLDGFDLGVGVLFGTTRDADLRTRMIDSISPFWDGNETWLVVVGAGLFAAFPAAYAVFLGAFYVPVLLLLVGLVFRGVAFEFRHHGTRLRPLWDAGFVLGSTLVAFVQGVAIGVLFQGIPVANRQFAGTALDWLAPLPLTTGVGLVLGYAWLGAGWLVLKSEGNLRHWARRRVGWLAVATLAVYAAAVALTFAHSAAAQTRWAERPWVAALPGVGLVALWGTRAKHDGLPFALAVLFFASAYAALGTTLWPYLVPYELTVADAAAPDASLGFFFWGGALVLPLTALYTARVYWIFRGKTDAGYR